MSRRLPSRYARRSGLSRVATTPRKSWERPLVSESALSTCSWMRRTYASTSRVWSVISGSAMIEAVIVVPVRVTTPLRARWTPSMTTWRPPAVRAICRITPTVPMACRSGGCGSSALVVCNVRKTMRSPAVSARLTASIETGRLMVSGRTPSGNATPSRSGSTGSSAGITGSGESAIGDQTTTSGCFRFFGCFGFFGFSRVLWCLGFTGCSQARSTWRNLKNPKHPKHPKNPEHLLCFCP